MVIGSLIIWCNGSRIIRDENRRQGYGYSSSIVHFTTGGDDQTKHAQSEINVNMDHQPVHKLNDNRIRSTTKSPDLTTKASVAYYKYEKAPKYHEPPVPSYLTQKYVQQVPKSEPESSFNVGYSIGFGNTQAEQRPYQPPRYIPTEIVTGTPNGKVAKPNDVQPKDYVLHAMEDLQKHGLSFPKAKHPKTELTDASFNKPQFAALVGGPPISQNYQAYTPKPKLYHKEEVPIYKPNDEESYGWKTLSPTLEVAGSSLVQPVRKTQKKHHKSAPIKYVNHQEEEKPYESSNFQVIQTKYEVHNQQPKESERHQHSFDHKSNNNFQVIQAKYEAHNQQPKETEHSFDHAQALGHSQGFDYSNAVNLDYAGSSTTQQVSSTPRYMNDPIPTSFQSGPVQIDKTLLENFYTQYKPVSLNWFQNHDALPNQESKEPESPKPIYAMDTRLLQSMPYKQPIPIDTSLLQKMLTSHSDASLVNPSQPNSIFALPSHQDISFTTDSTNEIETKPKESRHREDYRQENRHDHRQEHRQEPRQEHRQDTRQYPSQLNGHQFPPELFSNQKEEAAAPKHYHHVMSHEQRNHQQSVPQGSYRGGSENYQSHRVYHQQQEQSQDQHGSHSAQVITAVPTEQIIKGKPKKPGVVRHPRLLNENLSRNTENLSSRNNENLRYNEKLSLRHNENRNNENLSRNNENLSSRHNEYRNNENLSMNNENLSSRHNENRNNENLRHNENSSRNNENYSRNNENVSRNINSQPTLQYYNLDTALRPPPVNFVLPKNE